MSAGGADVDVAELAEELAELKQELDEERAARRELEEELAEERAARRELEERVDERPSLSWEERNPAEIEVEHPEGWSFPLGRAVTSRAPEDRVDAVESRVQDLETGDVDVDEEPSGPSEPAVERETPLEEVVAMPEEVADENLTPNQQRARFVATDVRDYVTRAPAGHVVSAGELRRIIVAGTESKGHSETIDRVIGFLDELGAGHVDIIERDRERRVVFDDDLVERLTRLTSRPSSHGAVTRVSG